MSIRLLNEEDAENLYSLRLRALREEPGAFVSTHHEERTRPVSWTAEQLRAARGASDEGVLGAIEGNALVGMLGITREQAPRARHRAGVWGMYIVPEARRRGHGKALLETAVLRLRKAPGVEQIHVAVIADDAVTLSLYKRVGFEIVGTLPNAMKDGGRYRDEHVLVLRVKPQTA